MLVGGALIGGLVLGVQKVQVTYAAGSLARALARGEPVQALASQLGVAAEVSFLSDFACVTAKVKTEPISIEERSCARKLGL
jgi:hypothetical protein